MPCIYYSQDINLNQELKQDSEGHDWYTFNVSGSKFLEIIFNLPNKIS